MKDLRTRSRTRLIVAALTAMLASTLVYAEETAPPKTGPYQNIHVINFESDIEAMMWAYVKRRVEEARADGADCIVLRIESPGGTVYHSTEIGDLLYALPDDIHTVAWVPDHAISGACLVAMACNEIIMAPGATLGDCQPILIDPTGGGIKPVGEKMETVLRALFRKYAQKNGYPVLLAEAFVSEHLEILRVESRLDGKQYYVRGETFREAAEDAKIVDGVPRRELRRLGDPVVTDTQLLTVTASEAKDLGFLARSFDTKDGLPVDEAAVLRALEGPDAKVTYHEMSFSESASKVLLAIAGVLSAIVALSILVFMWQGPGLMTIVGGVAFVLVLLIHATADQLHGFPIFLVLLGALLIAAEVFVIPGFGVAGVLGIASMGAGFLFFTTGTTIESPGTLSSDAVVGFGLQFVGTAILGFILLFTLSRWFPSVGPARRMILAAPEVGSLSAVRPAAGGGVATTDGVRVGAVGVTTSPLRPAGRAEFDGKHTDVICETGFAGAGQSVRVVSIEGERVTVSPVEEESA